MSTPKLIIKYQRSPFWKLFWSSLFLVFLGVSFYFGRYLAIEERQETLDKTVWLQEKLDEYQEAYLKTNEKLIVQTQSAKVDTQSNQELVDSIKQLQQTQRELEAEITFYRNIMAPELSQNGLTIAEFEITKEKEAPQVTFKLVLTQAGRQEQFMKGEVKLTLKGVINGHSTEYDFSELGTFQTKHFQFQFKYFQNIEGEILLPQDFVAEKLLIVAKTKGLQKNQVAEKQLDWSSLSGNSI